MDTNSFLPNTPNAESEPVSDAIPDKSVQRRRTFSREQKRRIVQDVLSSGESFSIAARRHNVNTNLLFKWRQQYEQGRFEPEVDPPDLVPITLASESTPEPTSEPHRFPRSGRMEIVLANGHRLSITGSACSSTLRTVLETLRS